jgi:hypothetical protein
MAPCWDCASEQDFELNGHFSGFLLPLNLIWESSTLLYATSLLGKIVVSCLKTYQDVLLFENLPLHRFERVFPRLFAGSPFSPTMSKSIWIPHNFQDTCDSRVAIVRSIASPRSLSPWTLPHPSFIRFTLCISRPVSYHGAPCLWH